MAFEHMYDLVVTTGDYKDRQGNNKKKWLTIGKMFQGDKGPFIVMDPWINLGALPRGEKGSVMVSCFEPKDNDSAPRQQQSQQQQSRKQSGFDYPDDDIPF